jgi:phosphatidylinositol dimannoside acyltransferase
MAESLGERLTGVGYRLGWKVISRVPESWARAAFMTAADIAWRRQGPAVQRLEANLRRVIDYDSLDPEEAGAALRDLSRATMRSYARYWVEAFRLQVIPPERIVSGMHMKGPGEQIAFEHMKAGRGVLFVLPHMGNFEQAGAWVVLRGAGTLVTIAERLKPESVYQAFLKFRQSLGMEVVPLTGGPNAFGVVAQRLRAGGLACIVMERDLKDTGVEVDFFGEKAKFAATAALAVHTDAVLMPVACWFEGEHDWGAHIYDEIPVPEGGDRKEKVQVMTQRLATVFEQAIREHPQDWHMLQRVFVADIEPAAEPGAEPAAGPAV